MGELKREFRDFIAGLMSLPVNIPGSQLRRSLQAKKRMVSLVKRLIADRRGRSCSGSIPQGQQAPGDVMDVLLSDGELSDDLIADNMIDLMIPGEDSVPILITLAVKYLSGSLEALREVEAENARLLQDRPEEEEEEEPEEEGHDGDDEQGKHVARSPSWSDFMSRLPFTQHVVSETLRLGNIISGVIRRAVRDVEVKGHLVPEGWCVLTYFRSVHLDQEHYDDPHKFDPWRWQQRSSGTCGANSGSCSGSSNSNSNSSVSFTPFGGGQRLCPGLDLAKLEAAIFLHHLVTGFTWEAEDDTVVCFPTVRMKRRMPIRVRRKTGTVPGDEDESAVSSDDGRR